MMRSRFKSRAVKSKNRHTKHEHVWKKRENYNAPRSTTNNDGLKKQNLLEEGTEKKLVRGIDYRTFRNRLLLLV